MRKFQGPACLRPDSFTGAGVILRFLQRKLMYHPLVAANLRVAEFREVTSLYPAARDVRLVCADGTQIGAWLMQKSATRKLTAQQGARPFVIYFHGNSGNRASRIPSYRMIEKSGCDVLAVDYPGYGDSEGRITESALHQSAEAAWDFVTSTLQVPVSQIILMGVSLGGAAAIHTAFTACAIGRMPAALFTVATFSSMIDVAQDHHPWLPVKWILVDRYRSDLLARDITCPYVTLHGNADLVVHERFGRRLFDAFPPHSADGTPKRWVTMHGIGHQDLMASGGQTIAAELRRLSSRVRQRMAGDAAHCPNA